MSEQKYKNSGVVILAAGKGTRLNCVDTPKVMLEIGGRPIVSYTVETLEKMGFPSDRIMMVVGFQKEKIKDYFGDRVSYAIQEEKKGTAHATYTGMIELPDCVDNVLVLGGDDSAFYSVESLEKFMDKHFKYGCVLSLLSCDVEDPSMLGRVIRHENSDIEVIEKEYLTEEQKNINEISTGTFCFNRNWFEKIFPKMPPLRKLGEWGLPTAIAMARDEKAEYQVVKLENSDEWFGVNTLEQLQEADRRKKKNKKLAIFDMDGVLVDSELQWTYVEDELYKKFGVSDDPDFKQKIMGLKLHDIVELIKNEHNKNISKEEIYSLYNEVAEKIYKSNSQIMPGVEELLNYLKNKDYKLTIGSSSPDSWIEMVLDKFDLRKYFKKYYSAESLNLKGKPDPALYNFIMKDLGFSHENTVVFEDSQNGYKAAIASGAKTVAVIDKRWCKGDYSDADLVVESLDDKKITVFLKI